MTDKQIYNNKIDRLKKLIMLTRNRIVGYSEFLEIKELLSQLGGMSDTEYEAMLKKYSFDFDKLYSNIIDDKDIPHIDRIKTSEMIGTLSGTTLNLEYRFVKNYDKFLDKIEKKLCFCFGKSIYFCVFLGFRFLHLWDFLAK